MRVIILLSIPFNSFFEERMQLTKLLDKGFNLEVFDMSFFMMKKALKLSYSSKDNRVIVTNFKNKKSLFLKLKQLKNSDVIIDYSNQDPKIRHVINKLNIKIIRIQGGGVPTLMPNTLNEQNKIKVNNFLNLWIRFETIKNAKLSYIIHALKNKILLRLFKPYIDVLFLCGNELVRNEQNYINENTRVIKAHDFDFDKFKLNELTLVKTKKRFIFIDQMLTSHPELTIKNRIYANPKMYFKRLRHFFDIVEKETGVEIAVALHPRNISSKETLNFGKREIFFGKTLELIRDSMGVITHASTAVNFAILFKKPILFISDKELISQVPETKALYKWLNQECIMLDKKIVVSDIICNIEIDESVRKKYKESFIICNESTQNMTLIDLLILELKRLSQSA